VNSYTQVACRQALRVHMYKLAPKPLQWGAVRTHGGLPCDCCAAQPTPHSALCEVREQKLMLQGHKAPGSIRHICHVHTRHTHTHPMHKQKPLWSAQARFDAAPHAVSLPPPGGHALSHIISHTNPVGTNDTGSKLQSQAQRSPSLWGAHVDFGCQASEGRARHVHPGGTRPHTTSPRSTAPISSYSTAWEAGTAVQGTHWQSHATRRYEVMCRSVAQLLLLCNRAATKPALKHARHRQLQGQPGSEVRFITTQAARHLPFPCRHHNSSSTSTALSKPSLVNHSA